MNIEKRGREVQRHEIHRKTGDCYYIFLDKVEMCRSFANLPSSLHPDPVSCTTWFVWSPVSSGFRHARINISSMACLPNLDSASPCSHEECLEGLDFSILLEYRICNVAADSSSRCGRALQELRSFAIPALS